MDNTVEYVDETGLLFRSYRKGGGSVTDGLQVYRDGVLVGDVDAYRQSASGRVEL